MPKKTASEPKSPNPIPISTRRRAAALFPKQDRSALLLPGEDPQKLQTLYAEYHDYFRPTSIVEVSIISQMVAATWRSHRTAATESARIVEKAEELMGEHRKTHNGEVHYDRLMAQATEALTPFLTSINRTYTTCRNMFRSALADLEKVRKLKGDPTQPFLPAPDVLECLTNLAEPQPEPKSPARIFEMPAPILDPEPDPAQQPAAAGPEPEPAPTPRTPCEWFESEDYVEPAPPTAEPPPLPAEPNQPLLDIHGNPIVIHKQTKPVFKPGDFQLTASPTLVKLVEEAIRANKNKPKT